MSLDYNIRFNEPNSFKIIRQNDFVTLLTFNKNCSEIAAQSYLDSRLTEADRINHQQFKLLSTLLEWDSLVISSSDDGYIYISSSLGASFTYLSFEGELVLSKSEKLLISNYRADERLIKSLCQPENRKIYSLTSFQGEECFKNILVPGMFIKIGASLIEEGWHFDINEVCENDDDNQTATAFASKTKASLEGIHGENNLPKIVQLSSGIDSALIAAGVNAIKEKDSFIMTNFSNDAYTDEIIPAEFLASSLSLKFVNFSKTMVHNTWTDYSLYKSYWDRFDPLRSYSHMTQVSMNFTFAPIPYIGYHTTISGCSMPTNLTIEHHCDYSKFTPVGQESYLKKKKMFELIRGSYTCSNEYEINCEDKEFEKYIIESLGVYAFLVYQASRPENMLPISPSNQKFFIPINEVLYSNIRFIITKLSSSDFFNKLDIHNYSKINAQKILKMINFFSSQMRVLTAFRSYSLASVMDPCEVLCTSSITKIALRQRINSLLVENSKWHIFRAFEILTGKKFSDYYKESHEVRRKAFISCKEIDETMNRRHPFLDPQFYRLLGKRHSNDFNNLYKRNFISTESIADYLGEGALTMMKYRYLDKLVSISRICFRS